jgi:hypothetical protein
MRTVVREPLKVAAVVVALLLGAFAVLTGTERPTRWDLDDGIYVR